MHTFLKVKGKYKIGMWLPDLTGRTSFAAVLGTCDTLAEAVATVNVLNGGPTGSGRYSVPLTEVEDEE